MVTEPLSQKIARMEAAYGLMRSALQAIVDYNESEGIGGPLDKNARFALRAAESALVYWVA